MPSEFLSLDTGFPAFSEGESTDTVLRQIQDYLFSLLEQLRYALGHLSPDNFNDAGLKELSDVLKVNTVISNTVISNTVITNNLYSTFGDIAELTVDRLISVDKIERYKNSDTSDINFIWIQGQHIQLMTGTTTGNTVQHVDRNGAPLYWNDVKHGGMSTDVTPFPVIVYQYEEACKADFGFEIDQSTGYYTPKITLGLGDGVKENSAKAYLYKSQNGLDITYFAANTGQRRRMLLSNDGIFFEPPILIFPDAKNASAVSASAATTMTGIDVTFFESTKVAFDVQIDVTASAAMSLLVEARVAGKVQRHCTKYFSGAYKDTVCFNGVFDGVATGKKTIDVVITPSVGTATIAVNDYRLMLTVRNGEAGEGKVYPEIKVMDYLKVKGMNLTDDALCAAQLPAPCGTVDTIAFPGLSDSVSISLATV